MIFIKILSMLTWLQVNTCYPLCLKCYICERHVYGLNFVSRSDNKDYALKLIEGTGYSQSFSLSACREVAV